MTKYAGVIIDGLRDYHVNGSEPARRAESGEARPL
jgi:hypothetical protein